MQQYAIYHNSFEAITRISAEVEQQSCDKTALSPVQITQDLDSAYGCGFLENANSYQQRAEFTAGRTVL